MDQAMCDLLRADPRYAYEAYEFFCDAVTFTQESLGRTPQDDDEPDADFHVSAAELARGACELAVQEYGLMAWVVFKHWGVTGTDDIGNVVFNLIRADRLSRSDRDDPEGFRDLFDLERALTDGFELSTAGARTRGKGKR